VALSTPPESATTVSSACFVTARRMLYIAGVRKRDRLTVDVAALDGEGAGVGEHDGVRVHIAGALPGERALAAVEHLSPHRPDAWAALERVERPSPERVAPACAAYGACGGCPLEHLAYPSQVKWKSERAADLLGQIASVAPCVPSPRPLGYRNRSKLVYGIVDGRRVLGAYAPRSHRLVDLAGCRVAEPPLDDVAQSLAALLDARAVAPYDERTGEGLLRYAILRVNFAGEVLATLVTAAEWSGGGELARALMAARPEVAGVVENLNASRGNVLYGERDRPLAGRAFLVEDVGGVKLRLSPTAFFQVNRDVAARIYADVRDAAQLGGGERVVDAYSGAGGVALTLAPRAREVIGVEEWRAAVDDAQASAEFNGVQNARFVCADTARGLAELDRADVVVLNPPRRGCDPAVLDGVARLGARRVLYVSCSPDTLARDLQRLASLGYATRAITPYDMIPQTPHLEALAVATRTRD